jgi:signal transduction histidine kinase
MARGLTMVMRRALSHFEAQHAIVVLRDPESERYFTWDVTHRGRRTRIGLRVSEDDPLPLPFAAPSEAFLANDLRPGARSALCYDVLSGAITKKPIPPTLPLPGGAQNLLAAPILIQDERRGHALIVREVRRKFARDDLELMVLIVTQAAAGFETVRLGQKAEEVAVLEERARIARDLHDGFIQSLAGIDLRIEKCKRLLQRDPGRLPGELEELHQAVDHGYRDVRRYLHVLRTAKRESGDLWSTLDRVASEFWTRDRLRVELTHPPGGPELAASTSFELEQIAREALGNAVRHGRATQASVSVALGAAQVTMVVRDNGSGFPAGATQTDADGFLAPTDTPWSIRERTEALGGSLRVRTHPGRGAEVAVTIPAGSRRSSTDRRMYA